MVPRRVFMQQKSPGLKAELCQTTRGHTPSACDVLIQLASFCHPDQLPILLSATHLSEITHPTNSVPRKSTTQRSFHPSLTQLRLLRRQHSLCAPHLLKHPS